MSVKLRSFVSRFRTSSMILNALVRDKRGLTGLLILIFYALLGGVGPYFLPYDPILSQNLADANAMPDWLAPPDIPRTMNISLDNWTVTEVSKEGDVNINITNQGRIVIIKIWGKGAANISLLTNDYLYYTYQPARSMRVSSVYSVVPIDPVNNTILNVDKTDGWYSISYYLYNQDLYGKNTTVVTGGVNYTLPMGLYIFYSDPGFRIGYINPFINEAAVNKSVDKRLPDYILNIKQPTPIPEAVNSVRELLLAKDTRLRAGVNISYYCDPMSFLMKCEGESGVMIIIRRVHITIYGLAFGLLGTNDLGSDVFTQFVYGARTAIIFGFSVAIAIVIMGLFVGVFAGYNVGKLSDYITTFITDVIYFLPTLPLILAAGIVFGRSIVVIYLVIVLLSWPGTARVIRSWTMALKSELYVEAAQALGAGTGRILIKHIIPQLVPYMVYAVVVGVPGAVFTEVAVQLLGFGDPTWPSWGRILNEAYYRGAISGGVWWWILPPIFGIVTLALGFALMGLALDEIANPRLRRRM
jgi:ABC-type dipeptide/oligopeptide/nickel transport system permease subunit